MFKKWQIFEKCSKNGKYLKNVQKWQIFEKCSKNGKYLKNVQKLV